MSAVGVLAVTAPIYLIVIVGFLFTRLGVFARADMRVLSSFVVNVGLPALILSNVATRRWDELINPTYVVAYGAGTMATLAVGVAYARCLLRDPVDAAAYEGLGFAGSNTGFVGYSLMLLVMPQSAGPLLAMNLICENTTLLPAVLGLAEWGKHRGRERWRAVGRTMTALVRRPLVASIIVAIVWSLGGIPMPEIAARSLDLFGRASTAVALFAIGGMLCGVRASEAPSRVTAVSLGKLVLHPVLVAGTLLVATAGGMDPLAPQIVLGLLLSSALPNMTIYPMLAEQVGHGGSASLVLLLTTSLSFVTISLLLALLGG